MTALTRSARILATVLREYAAGTSLAATRKVLGKEFGESPDAFLGTADPIYYRLKGEADPIVVPGSPTRRDGKPTATFAKAVRRRLDAGNRLNVVAASASVTLGRKVTTREVKALYAAAGGDLDTRYAGRGTRVGAPGTYGDDAAAIRSGEIDA